MVLCEDGAMKRARRELSMLYRGAQKKGRVVQIKSSFKKPNPSVGDYGQRGSAQGPRPRVAGNSERLAHLGVRGVGRGWGGIDNLPTIHRQMK